jgi:fused signal recognition particle receptor
LLRFLGRRKKEDREKTARAVDKTRKAWFGRVAALFRGARLDQELWDELEELLISADIGVGPTQDLLERLQTRVREDGISRSEDALDVLKREMVAKLTVGDAARRLDVETAPLVLLVVGVNGVGKTTSIAKLAQLYTDDGKRVLLGAADTFRAAAIEQLQSWGERVGVDVIAHRPDADPGAVAFDTLNAARARGVDVVIIDTAGRLHSKVNLMEEVKKIQRVLARQDGGSTQRVLLALDATTGQNGLFQARAFTEALDCDGVILAKLDGTAKGGVVVAIADELKLPVLFVGTGEQPDDIAPFDPQGFVDALFGSESPAQ